MSPSRAVLCLMLGTAALRVGLAAGTGLGIDESYMVAAGRTLQLSYFDHPPMAWWLSRLAALAAGSEAPVVVRLPFVALFAASTWLMFRWTARLFGERAGLWAAVGLNLSPVLGVTSATWVLPDGPLAFGLLGVACCLARSLEARPSPRPSPAQARARGRRVLFRLPLPQGEGWGEGLAHPFPPGGGKGLAPSPWTWWLLTGLSAGLALLSKYSAILVLAGAAVYLFTQPAHRGWLRRPHPYVAALVALACCSPTVLWNAQHGWTSFAFQGGRAATHSVRLLGPVTTLAGEALFLLPWIWLPLVLAWIAALRAGPASRRSWLPACLGAAPIVLFAVVSLWARNVLFHWAAPGYLMLFPLLGEWAARAELRRPLLLRRGWQAAAATIGLGCALLLVETHVNLLARFGVDPGLAVADWTALRDQLGRRGLLGAVVAATTWADAGKLGYALGGQARVVCLNPDARQFQFLSSARLQAGDDALLLGPGLTMARLAQSYAAEFDSVQPLPPLQLRGNPMPLFLARGFRG